MICKLSRFFAQGNIKKQCLLIENHLTVIRIHDSLHQDSKRRQWVFF